MIPIPINNRFVTVEIRIRAVTSFEILSYSFDQKPKVDFSPVIVTEGEE